MSQGPMVLFFVLVLLDNDCENTVAFRADASPNFVSSGACKI